MKKIGCAVFFGLLCTTGTISAHEVQEGASATSAQDTQNKTGIETPPTTPRKSYLLRGITRTLVSDTSAAPMASRVLSIGLPILLAVAVIQKSKIIYQNHRPPSYSFQKREDTGVP